MSIGRALRWGSDRRSAKRVPVNHVFMHGRALAGSLDLDTRIDLVCVDVSETGCLALCSSRRGLAVGDLVRLQLAPTSGRSHGFRARVVRTLRDPQGRHQIAFLFEQLSAADRMRILDWHAWWSSSASARAGSQQAEGDDERTAAINAAVAAARRALDAKPPAGPQPTGR